MKSKCAGKRCGCCGFNAAVNAARAKELRTRGLIRGPDGLYRVNLGNLRPVDILKKLGFTRDELAKLMEEL